MSSKYKTYYSAYPAWNYPEEIRDLNRASEKGWQLVKGGRFHSKFVYNPDVRYCYQMDYRHVDEMMRYIETFREQGWEYISSTFNDWHYFRKVYDPSLPEEAYEIFTDRESLREMKSRFVKFSLLLGILLGIYALLCLVRLLDRPSLPILFRTITFALIGAVMFFDGLMMRNRKQGHYYRGARTIFAILICTVIIGWSADTFFSEIRPELSVKRTERISGPVSDYCWADFDVNYSDNYYLELRMKSEVPFRFEIFDENGKTVLSETESDLDRWNIRVPLQRGKYRCSVTAQADYELRIFLK